MIEQKNGNIIIKNNISELGETCLNDIADEIVNIMQIEGFPHYKELSNDEFNKIVGKLDSKSCNEMLRNGKIHQDQTGIKLINSFHPHMWQVQCQNFKTAWDIYSNDALLRNAIAKFMGIMTTNIINQRDRIVILKTSSGAQAVSNFRPSVAKLIYTKFAGKNASVLDPCAGYGGRLLGAWCSPNIVRYVGCDPCTKTYEGNLQLAKRLKENSNIFIPRPDIKLCHTPFEDFNTDEKFDLIFTSPPYFNTEKYSNEDTQSWKRYPYESMWYDKFLEVLIKKSKEFLKPNGMLILNVSPAMKNETIKRANKYFKDYKCTVIDMVLSLLPVRAHQTTREEKVEPVIIYSKGVNENTSNR